MSDQKLWTATIIVYTMGETEEEAKENIKRGIIEADDFLLMEEDSFTHIKSEEHRKRLIESTFRELKRRERRN